MTFTSKLSLTAASLILMAATTACSNSSDTSSSEAPAAAQAAASVSLDDVLAHPRRAEQSARDQFRNPKETLEFFEVTAGKKVAEISPGWYTNVIAPYLAENGGTYVAVLNPAGASERGDQRNAAFKERFSDTAVYGDIEYGGFGKDNYAFTAPGTADVVLTFRNVHNWMGRGYAQEAFDAFYAALKPGGILGVVEHRLPESAEQNPRGNTGYVQESYMKDLAAKAGFEFVAASEVNANPKDTADHPFGVWTLPPASFAGSERNPAPEGFDAAAFKNIGESDRATLKFRKPK
jgi:predicted methyltransferase